jgi:hypothetical protein
MSHVIDKVPFGLCPLCKGICYDLDYPDTVARRKLALANQKRERALIVLGTGIIAIPLVTIFFTFAPIEILLLASVFGYAISNVLQSQQLLDDLIGGDSLFADLNETYSLFDDRPRPVLTGLFVIAAVAAVLFFLVRYHQYRHAFHW